ncbi:MAG: hypothetical protein PHC40_06965 [Eubacteriales bacterium]|nr:hypothetical protein [Eubacteriales bacterium]
MSGRSLFQGTKVRCLIIKTRKEINLVFQNRVLTTGGIIKDYATLQWDITLDSSEYPYEEGTIRITLTGVVGKQVDKYHVNTPALVTPYYYEDVFVGFPDYSPKEPSETAPITGWVVNCDFPTDSVIAKKGKVPEAIIALAEKNNKPKVSNVKLIPILEGAKMTVQLIDCDYFAFYQFHYPAWPGTSPLLMELVDYGGIETHSFQMWADQNPVVSNTFKKITDDEGSFRIYPFPDEYNTEATPIAFYVVNEAEAKTLMGRVPATSANNATPTASKVMVNGSNVSFDAYNIFGNNYFKLRDLAKVVSGTEKQFAVGYDNAANAITLTSGNPYTTLGGELSAGDGKAKAAKTTTSKIYVDGKQTAFTAYNIGGNNYFKLRDVAKVLNINVGYDTPTKVITIDTEFDYEN